MCELTSYERVCPCDLIIPEPSSFSWIKEAGYSVGRHLTSESELLTDVSPRCLLSPKTSESKTSREMKAGSVNLNVWMQQTAARLSQDEENLSTLFWCHRHRQTMLAVTMVTLSCVWTCTVVFLEVRAVGLELFSITLSPHWYENILYYTSVFTLVTAVQILNTVPKPYRSAS